MTRPRVVVVGAGGLGSYFGVQCARAGYPVTLVARGAHKDAIVAHGVELVMGGERHRVPVGCVSSTSDAGLADLVLLCVKHYDLETAAATLSPLLHADTVVLCAQNGVDNLERVRVGSPARRLGAVVFEAGANRVAPGVIEKGSAVTHLVIGGREAGSVEHARWTCDILGASGIGCSASEDPAAFLRAQWRKLSRIASLSGVSCVTRASAGALIGTPRIRALLISAVEEALRVAAAAGVSLVGENVVEETLEICQRFPQMRTSMLRDLERGAPIEIDAFSGAIVRAATSAGIDAPVHRFISAALALAESGVPPA